MVKKSMYGILSFNENDQNMNIFAYVFKKSNDKP